jgi:signal transduction histidine kinase
MKAAIEGSSVFLQTDDYRRIPVLAAGEPVGEEGWGFVVKMDQKEADKPIFLVVMLEAVAGLIMAALGLLAAYILARNFTHPLVQLENAALRVAAGDYHTAVPVRSDDDFGSLSSSFNAMTTAIQMRNDERERAEEAMREADRRKDEFLAMLGHELRNPLSAIANAVRLWNAAPEDRSSTELARDVIERQSTHLSRLVDDLLDVGRITEGKIDLRKQPVDVVQAISHAVEAARPFIDDRRHELEISLADEAKLFVEADPTRFEQIITNLLTNAIKYTRRAGRISIKTRKEGTDVVICIADNGIGMSARMIPHVFDLFAQGDRSLDRTTGGLGIGLHLCQKLVELHGGTVTAASEGVGPPSPCACPRSRHRRRLCSPCHPRRREPMAPGAAFCSWTTTRTLSTPWPAC